MTNIDDMIVRAARLCADAEKGKVELYMADQYSRGCFLRDAGQLLDVVNTLLCHARPTPEVKP